MKTNQDQGRNWKGKQIIRNIPTDNITELNGFFYAGAKLVSDMIGILQGT